MLGLSFKGGTDDCRESPAIDIIQHLLTDGKEVTITAYDPKAADNAKAILKNQIIYASDAYSACQDADVVAVLTEWKEFTSLDLSKIKHVMKQPLIIDLRGMLDEHAAKELGFTYRGIGH